MKIKYANYRLKSRENEKRKVGECEAVIEM